MVTPRKSRTVREAERALDLAISHREVTSVTIAAQQSLTPGEFAHFLRKVMRYACPVVRNHPLGPLPERH